MLLQDVPDASVARTAESCRALAELTFDGVFPGHHLVSLNRGHDQVMTAVRAFDSLGMPVDVGAESLGASDNVNGSTDGGRVSKVVSAQRVEQVNGRDQIRSRQRLVGAVRGRQRSRTERRDRGDPQRIDVRAVGTGWEHPLERFASEDISPRGPGGPEESDVFDHFAGRDPTHLRRGLDGDSPLEARALSLNSRSSRTTCSSLIPSIVRTSTIACSVSGCANGISPPPTIVATLTAGRVPSTGCDNR